MPNRALGIAMQPCHAHISQTTVPTFGLMRKMARARSYGLLWYSF